MTTPGVSSLTRLSGMMPPPRALPRGAKDILENLEFAALSAPEAVKFPRFAICMRGEA